jgi:hypothetical protein
MRSQILELYKPELRLLKSAQLDYPIIRGSFMVGPTYYSLIPIEHATDIEIQLCLNQLCYWGIQEIVDRKLINELSDIDCLTLQKEKMVIVESKKRFRRPISSGIIIYGEATLKKLRLYKNVIFIGLDFDFERKSCLGSLELAIIK